jgi:hypothetical protein
VCKGGEGGRGGLCLGKSVFGKSVKRKSVFRKECVWERVCLCLKRVCLEKSVFGKENVWKEHVWKEHLWKSVWNLLVKDTSVDMHVVLLLIIICSYNILLPCRHVASIEDS